MKPIDIIDNYKLYNPHINNPTTRKLYESMTSFYMMDTDIPVQVTEDLYMVTGRDSQHSTDQQRKLYDIFWTKERPITIGYLVELYGVDLWTKSDLEKYVWDLRSIPHRPNTLRGEIRGKFISGSVSDRIDDAHIYPVTATIEIEAGTTMKFQGVYALGNNADSAADSLASGKYRIVEQYKRPGKEYDAHRTISPSVKIMPHKDYSTQVLSDLI